MADVARGSVLLTPRFDNLMQNIEAEIENAFGKSEGAGAKAGRKTGESYTSATAAKIGAISGLVSTITSGAFNTISNSLSSAISRVDTMANFPKVMKNLGYSTDEAEAAIKRMSTSIDGLPTSLPALTSMVQQLAPLTGGLDQATSIGIAFNDMCLAAGASTADVSRAMQQYSQILSKGKPDLQDWKTLQEVMPGQLNQVAKALLGPTANSKELYSALQDGSISMDDFNNAVMKLDQEGVDGFASFAQQAKDSTQGIGTAVENVQNRVAKAIQTVIEAIGQENISGAINAFSSSFSVIGNSIATVINGIKTVIGTAGSAISSAFESIKSAIPQGVLDALSGAFQTLAPAIIAAAGAFVVLLPVLGGLSKIATIAKSVSVFGTVLTSVAGGPVGLAIAAIVALVAGFAALYNTNDQVKAAVATAWTAIQQAFATACTVIQSAIDTAWPVIQQVVTTVMNTVQNAVVTYWPVIQQAFATACTVIQQIITAAWPVIQAVVNTVMQAINLIVNTVWPTIQNIFMMACTVIMTIVSTVWPIIQTIVTTVMTVIMTIVSTVWPIIQAAFTAACTVIATIINTVWPVIQTVITTVMNVINAIIGTVLAAIDGNWSGVWTGIKAIATTIWDGIQSVISAAINAVSSIISSVLGTIQGVWDSIWGTISGAFSSIWEGIKTAAKSGIDTVYNTVTGIKDKITGFFSGAGQWLVDSGKAILNGLGDGIKSALGGLENIVGGVMDTVRSWFPFSPAKKGPFSGHGYTTYSGAAMMGGLGEGIANGAKTAIAEAKSALVSVHNALDAEPISFDYARSTSRRASGVGGASLAMAGAGYGDTYNVNIDGDILRIDAEIAAAINTLVDRAKRSTSAGRR